MRVPPARRLPVIIALSALPVLLAYMLGLSGTWFGLALAVSVWFSTPGMAGAAAGYLLGLLFSALPVSAIVPSILALLAALAVLLALLKRWDIRAAEGQSNVGLVNLFQVFAIAAIVRELCWFFLFTGMNFGFGRGTFSRFHIFWGTVIAFNIVALAVALLLLRFATPPVRDAGLVETL